MVGVGFYPMPLVVIKRHRMESDGWQAANPLRGLGLWHKSSRLHQQLSPHLGRLGRFSIF